MRYKFNFHQVDPSQALMEYAKDELEKAGKYLLSDGSCQIIFRMGKFDCHVQFDVSSPWGHFKASSKAKDFYFAVDVAASKLSKQFLKMKEKHQNHKKVAHSKRGKLKRINPQLEYDNSPNFSPYFKKGA